MKKIKILSKEILYRGFNQITKYFFEFFSFDGTQIFHSDKEIFERKNAVAVLLYDPNLDSVVLIEQFRPGSFVAEGIAFPLEIPAGLVDEGDVYLSDVAKREAKEEANCEIEKLLEIGYFYPEISFSTRRIHLFCGKVNAKNIALNGGLKEDCEDTKISLMPVSELRKLLDENQIINSHSLIAVQWFFLNLDKVQKEFM